MRRTSSGQPPSAEVDAWRNPASRAASAVRAPTANTGNAISSPRRGCARSHAPRWRWSSPRAANGPAPKSAGHTGSMRSSGTRITVVTARAQHARRCVPRRARAGSPGARIGCIPIVHAKKSAGARRLSSVPASAPSAAASRESPPRRVFERPRCRRAAGSCRGNRASRPRTLGVAGDRRAARAVEHRQERALGGERMPGRRRRRSAPSRSRVMSSSTARARSRWRPARPRAGNVVDVQQRGRGVGTPEAIEPGHRQQRRVDHALVELAQARLDVAAQQRRPSGRAAAAAPWPGAGATRSRPPRRGASVVEARGLAADEGVAHVLARQVADDRRARAAARSAGPWRSGPRDRPRRRSAPESISLVNRPLPPMSVSGRSCTMSPEVRITTSSIASMSIPWAAAMRARTSRACASASGLPRVPMRSAVPIAPWDLVPGMQ